MIAATVSMKRRLEASESMSTTRGQVPSAGTPERDAERQGGEFQEPVAPSLIDPRWWDAFLADDDECDPLPEPGDFWDEADD